jgi:hypothetical protein
MKTELQYRTFDQLIDEVSTDFATYHIEGMIEPSQLIKVAQRVSYDLGLRIHGTKEKMLYIENYKVRLPDDFYILNYGYVCGKSKKTSEVLSGRQTEDVILNAETCECEKTYTVECNTGEKIFVQVVEKRKYETRIYEDFLPLSVSDKNLRLATSTGKNDALDNSSKDGYIKNGFLYTSFKEGRVYISYQGALEDLKGNLLVLDHPMINEYYEYAIKQRILENLYINGEDVAQKMQLIEQRLRAARNNALSIVNTPDFAEMYKLWQINRKAMYSKYVNMFKNFEGPFDY